MKKSDSNKPDAASVSPEIRPAKTAIPPRLWDDEGLRQALEGLKPGFRFSFRTMQEGWVAAQALSKWYPDPDTAEMGIWELIVNAIEHGNLGINNEEKSIFIAAGSLEEEIERRLRLPVFRDRVVEVEFCRTSERNCLVVRDQGGGFDYQTFVDREAFTDRPNGRGIVLARDLAFDDLQYRGCGNEVIATCEFSETAG
ncbi:ATP-binding protein [Roseibium sp.]|uniref:ATP-binding protein n=1 Tax=Roseibium sp. TaxID=1936156 RepID=UPI003A96C17A